MSKCVIKAKDLQLHRINVTTSGFLTIGPIPKDTLTTDPIPESIPKVALPFQRATEEEVTSSQPSIKEEEGIVEDSESKDSEDYFKIFNQTLSPEAPTGDLSHSLLASTNHNQEFTNVPDDMGIQASRGPPSKSYWSPSLGEICLGRQPQPSFPPFHPPSPSNLTQPITKGRWSKKVRRWWK